jgi:hypothetical protein
VNSSPVENDNNLGLSLQADLDACLGLILGLSALLDKTINNLIALPYAIGGEGVRRTIGFSRSGKSASVSKTSTIEGISFIIDR